MTVTRQPGYRMKYIRVNYFMIRPIGGSFRLLQQEHPEGHKRRPPARLSEYRIAARAPLL
jgi:hypothetical protein